MMMPLITLEGLDGAGKTTLMRRIEAYLECSDLKFYATRQPGGTVLGASIRELLQSTGVTICDISELMLFAADRAQHAMAIKGILHDRIVVCDRFSDSTFAYQGHGRMIDLDLIKQINLIALQGLTPSLTFFIDIPVHMAIARRKGSSADRIESEDRAFFERVRAGYQAIAKDEPNRVVTIDGSCTEEQVFSQVKRSLDCFLGLRD